MGRAVRFRRATNLFLSLAGTFNFAFTFILPVGRASRWWHLPYRV